MNMIPVTRMPVVVIDQRGKVLAVSGGDTSFRGARQYARKLGFDQVVVCSGEHKFRRNGRPPDDLASCECWIVSPVQS